MSLFEKAVQAYFREKLGCEIGRVDFEYDKGYRYSSYTFEDPHFKIIVWDTEQAYYIKQYVDESAGEFLEALFAWEEEEL